LEIQLKPANADVHGVMHFLLAPVDTGQLIPTLRRMKKFTLHEIADRIRSHAGQRNEVDGRAKCKSGTSYWVLRQGEWFALRWCRIYEYDGTVRFHNPEGVKAPKVLWPIPVVASASKHLEITLAESELDEKKFRRLAEIFTYPERALDWELLQEMTTETNLWSEAAVEAGKRFLVQKAKS
jgi:hypothetical protein